MDDATAVDRGPSPAVVALLAAVVLLGAVVGLSRTDDRRDVADRAAPTPCGPTVVKADGSPWRCDFADDFDGTTLDARRWMVATTEATRLSYGDCWVDSPANVRVAGGTLRLTTRRETQPVTCTADGGPVTSSFTSGSVTTFGRYTIDEGRVEVRARMPRVTVPGVQSALWLFPQTLEHTATLGTGEIDVAEYYGQYPDRLVPTLHYAATTPTYTNQSCLVDDPGDWHTYVVEWDRARVRVLYDATVCLDHPISASGAAAPGQPFDQDYTINLTQMLGSGANAPTATTPFPATLEVDHVRAWR
jgi:beta-glucanase (GH16 family)